MKKSGFSLMELIIIPVVILLLLAILLPSLMRARELSKRLVCGANTMAIGMSCKIYANDNNEVWPTPTFNENRIGHIRWQSAMPGDPDTDATGKVPGRRSPSTSETTTLSTTRTFWMLIRSGDNAPKQYICPSSGDIEEDSDSVYRSDLEPYYDFASLSHVSYGYLVPFGPEKTRPSENLDARAVVATDKGPFSTGHMTAEKLKALKTKLGYDSSLRDWQILNSPNHGRGSRGEGQNVLFADCHTTFEKRPIVGVDEDNIYTRMGKLYGGNDETLFNAICIGLAPEDNTYPGMNALGKGLDASTDSLIYP